MAEENANLGENTPANVEPTSSNDKTNGILCYLGILVLIPFLTVKEGQRSEYLIKHLRQGFGLLITGVAASIIKVLLSMISSTFGGLVYMVLGILIFVMFICGLINSIKGQYKDLPILGGFFDKNLTFIK
ncbi:MAG: hypothetical protein MJ211_04410 [Bacteroidales bacterium]|nr:hypothetical protein [Bacteroidales bacterium]